MAPPGSEGAVVVAANAATGDSNAQTAAAVNERISCFVRRSFVSVVGEDTASSGGVRERRGRLPYKWTYRTYLLWGRGAKLVRLSEIGGCVIDPGPPPTRRE